MNIYFICTTTCRFTFQGPARRKSYNVISKISHIMFTQVYFISQCTHVWLCWSMVGNTGGWFTLTNTRQRGASFLTSLQLCLISHVRDVWSPTETTDLLTHSHTKCLIMLAPFKGPSAVLSIECSLHYMVTAFTEHISLAIITLSCWLSCWVVKCRTVC